MLTRAAQRLASLRSDEGGFSLIELLVAMVLATVVVGALITILIVSLHQTARVVTRTQATQLGRTTMTRLVDELHSACFGKGVTPIQAGSNAYTLWFLSGVGTEAVPSKVLEHKVFYNSSEHTLTDEAWASTGGTWPTYSFPEHPESTTPASKTRIGEHILSVKTTSGGKPEIFQYYAYATTSNSATAVSTLSTEPLKEESEEKLQKNAAKAAAVRIAFKAESLPYPDEQQFSSTSELTSQVTFAFGAPSAETPIEVAPCE